MIAASNGHLDCIKLLISSPTSSSTSGGTTSVATTTRDLLEAECKNGKTALVRASEAGRIECARALVDAGADTSRLQTSGDSVLPQTCVPQ
jgi:ankyrin repeat protein